MAKDFVKCIGKLPGEGKSIMNSHPLLNFDGVYRCSIYDGLSIYLKFYANGRVKCITSYANIDKIPRYLDESHHNLLQGRFTITQNLIKFKVESEKGSVDYWGQILDNQLKLFSWNQKTNHRAERYYNWVGFGDIEMKNIQKILQKIVKGSLLDYEEVHYTNFPKYADVLLDCCNQCCTRTSRRVREIVRDRSMVDLKSTRFKLWL